MRFPTGTLSPGHKRLAAAGLAFLLALVAILPYTFRVAPVPAEFVLSADGDQAGWNQSGDPHGWSPDEDEYGWSAAYFGGRLAHLDFSPGDGDSDPGWSPSTYWALTQPMATRLVYAIAMGTTDAPAPAARPVFEPVRPLVWRADQARVLDPETRLRLRFVATLCAAAGLALIAWRLQWWGLIASVVFLGLPHVRSDLALAWAEGPLLLGLGLSIAGLGRRWFGAAVGLAAGFKLTALGLWPLLLIPGANGRGRYGPLRGLLYALAVWTFLEPPSWFAGGPLYLRFMLHMRVLNEFTQSTQFGMYVPARYLWPAELLLLVGLAAFARHALGNGLPALRWPQCRRATGTALWPVVRGS